MRTRRHIHPVTELAAVLRTVEQPARYVGGEVGSVRKPDDNLLTLALCFPDLYEIGMSNTAVKIIYDLVNRRPGSRCERVFTPARDMEDVLRAANQALYTLESGIPLADCDVLAFTLSYELSATNMLAVLDAGGIPLRRDRRDSHHPLVIAGGPAATNPAPIAPFVDAVFIGDAEAALPGVLDLWESLIRQGAFNRDSALAALDGQDSVFLSHRPERRVRRAWWRDFGKAPDLRRFPLPTIRPVQDNAVVEIMRGCPNGCRFCHAGRYYRPYRMKGVADIVREVDHAVFNDAHTEVTLASLSSGDYPEIGTLISFLHDRYKGRQVSFALPSLRVDSVTLPTIDALAGVRKSGLTFAVESPAEEGRAAINKTVDPERIVSILLQAKQQGWSSAKFYFMLGLPTAHSDGIDGDIGETSDDEVADIADFIRTIRNRTGMQLHVNVGTFVPKAHTPFQWCSQLSEAEAGARIARLKDLLRMRGVRFTFHSPFQSTLEGLISRGDEEVAELIEEAYRRGARFDAWEDRARREIWQELLASRVSLKDRILSRRPLEASLPWESIHFGTSRRELEDQFRAAVEGRLTERCLPACRDRCGICNSVEGVRDIQAPESGGAGRVPAESVPPVPDVSAGAGVEPEDRISCLLRFRRDGEASYLSHLDTMRAFQRAMVRGNLDPAYTQGFNPKVVMDFAQPLSMGMACDDEYMRVVLYKSALSKNVSEVFRFHLPDGLEVLDLLAWPERRTVEGGKKHSLMSLWWGADYTLACGGGDEVATLTERLADAALRYPGLVPAAVRPAADGGWEIDLRLCNYGGAAPGIGKLLGLLELRNLVSVRRRISYAADSSGRPRRYFEIIDSGTH